MSRLGRGCCSGCLWLVAIPLLIYGWVGSSWPLRAVELLTGAGVVVAAIYRQRHGSSESRTNVPAP